PPLPYTTLFRSGVVPRGEEQARARDEPDQPAPARALGGPPVERLRAQDLAERDAAAVSQEDPVVHPADRLAPHDLAVRGFQQQQAHPAQTVTHVLLAAGAGLRAARRRADGQREGNGEEEGEPDQAGWAHGGLRGGLDRARLRAHRVNVWR